MEDELLLLARAIDEKIKYMESKLEKPYMIGFNHSSIPVQEAEEIVDNFLKEIDAEIDEQNDIHDFLDGEIKESIETNTECTKFLTSSDSQLQELEAFVCSNVPDYKKFVPPEGSCSNDIQNIENNQEVEVVLDAEALESAVLVEGDLEIDNAVPENLQPDKITSSQDKNDWQNLDDLLENKIEAVELNDSFDQISLIHEEDIFPNGSQMDLVSSPLVDPDNLKVVAKKLDFDQLSTGPSQKKPFVCSTEKKTKTPVEIERKATTLKQLPEDIENISGIQNMESTAKTKLKKPVKPVRRILAEQPPVNQSESTSVEKVGASLERGGVNTQQLDQLLKGLPTSVSNLIRDALSNKANNLPTARQDKLRGRKDLPSGPLEGFPRDALSGNNELLSRRDTLGARKDLPTGLRDVLTRDTLSGRRDLPLDGFTRDTIGGRRDTLGGRKELPHGTERDTFSRHLPRGLRDGMQRDTLTGEIINSRRLSHYRAAPPKMRPLGTMPSSPKEPVLSEVAMKIINKYKAKG